MTKPLTAQQTRARADYLRASDALMKALARPHSGRLPRARAALALALMDATKARLPIPDHLAEWATEYARDQQRALYAAIREAQRTKAIVDAHQPTLPTK